MLGRQRIGGLAGALLGVMVLVALGAPGGVAAQEAAAQAPAIIVTGEGRVEAAPDMATLHIGVRARAETPGAALEEMSDRAGAVLARMEAAGIAARDLQTSELRLAPVWQRDRDEPEPRLIGHEATTRVTVRLRDLAGLGAVLDAAVADGADSFDGLEFGIAEPRALADEARRRAVADALRKAELYAEAAGVPLGPVSRITEAATGTPRPMMLRDAPMAMEAAVPIAEGELEITARVTLHFGPPD